MDIENNNDDNELDALNLNEIDSFHDFDFRYSPQDASWKQKKWFFIIIVLIVNFGLIVTTLITGAGVYIMIPFITLSHIRDVIFIILSLFFRFTLLKKKFWGPKTEIKVDEECPPQTIQIASIVTCYTEKFETVLETVNSLHRSSQECKEFDIKNIVICICDGQLTGKENSAPLGNLFLETMEEELDKMPVIRRYETWRGENCTSVVHFGYIQNNPFVLVRKLKNHGKKDGLILAKNIIKDINKKELNYNHSKVEYKIKYVFCTDADTAIGDGCLAKSVVNMEKYQDLDAAVCLLRVLFHKGALFWDHLQHFQYFSSQLVRRYTESIFAKVTCLSGAGNICRTSSRSYQYACHRYGEYPKTTSILDVVPKMNGTDRRWTTLMLKASRDTKIGMLDNAYVYTETPQDFLTYISQRKRWGSNSFSNSLVNITSRNIPWYSKVGSAIDVFRILSSYYRVMSYILFWVYIDKIRIQLVIFVAATVGLVYAYTFLWIILVGHKRLSLLYGFVINKLMTPIFTMLIFTEVLFRFDDFKWGSTQKVKSDEEEDIDLALFQLEAESDDYDVEHAEEENELLDGYDVHNGGGGTKFDMLMNVGKSHKNLGNMANLPAISSKRREKYYNSNDPPEFRAKYTKEWYRENYSASESEVEKTVDVVLAEIPLDSNGIPLPPPLPPSGPPVAPPPPPIVKKEKEEKSESESTKKRKRKKTRRIHFKPIDHENFKKSFWEKSGELVGMDNWNGIKTELEKIFELSEQKKLIAAHQQQMEQTIVGLQKATNSEIILKQFSKDYDSIGFVVKRVIMLDHKNIKLDQLQSISKLFPLAKKEMQLLKEVQEPDNLTKPDRFFYEMMKIPRCEERIRCTLFKRSLIRKLRNIRRNAVILQNVCVELRESEKFRDILKIIWEMGKVLNENSYLASNLKGFKLSDLSLLEQTKSEKDKGSISLLDYLISVITTKRPELLSFIEDMPSIDFASKTSIDTLQIEMNQMEKDFNFFKEQIKLARDELTKSEGDDFYQNCNRIFCKKFSPVYKKGKIEQRKLQKIFDETLALIKRTMMFYGEKAEELPSEKFFDIISKFSDSMIKCYEFRMEKRKKHKVILTEKGAVEIAPQQTVRKKVKRSKSAGTNVVKKRSSSSIITNSKESKSNESKSKDDSDVKNTNTDSTPKKAVKGKKREIHIKKI